MQGTQRAPLPTFLILKFFINSNRYHHVHHGYAIIPLAGHYRDAFGKKFLITTNNYDNNYSIILYALLIMFDKGINSLHNWLRIASIFAFE